MHVCVVVIVYDVMYTYVYIYICMYIYVYIHIYIDLHPIISRLQRGLILVANKTAKFMCKSPGNRRINFAKTKQPLVAKANCPKSRV